MLLNTVNLSYAMLFGSWFMVHSSWFNIAMSAMNHELSTMNYYAYSSVNNVLGSVTTPVTAAAAATSGLASIVRAPGP